MPIKIYDLAVKTGSYTDRQSGETKNRYENIGAVMQSDDGSKFMMLKRTFSPAGVPHKDGSDAILVSLFAPKDRDGAPRAAPTVGGAGQQRRPHTPPPQDSFRDDPIDDIPF